VHSVKIPDNTQMVNGSIDNEDIENRTKRENDSSTPHPPDPEIGSLGENIVEAYLKWKYKNSKIANETKKNIGYDFDVIKEHGIYECIEVKSTKNLYTKIQIYITTKELKTALKQGDSYYLYIVAFVDRQATVLYSIQNPAKLLNLTEYVNNLKKIDFNASSYIYPLQHLINANSSTIKKYEDKKFKEYIKIENALS